MFLKIGILVIRDFRVTYKKFNFVWKILSENLESCSNDYTLLISCSYSFTLSVFQLSFFIHQSRSHWTHGRLHRCKHSMSVVSFSHTTLRSTGTQTYSTSGEGSYQHKRCEKKNNLLVQIQQLLLTDMFSVVRWCATC